MKVKDFIKELEKLPQDAELFYYIFVSIDYGDGKKSRIYEIDEIYSLHDDAQVLVVKA